MTTWMPETEETILNTVISVVIIPDQFLAWLVREGSLSIINTWCSRSRLYFVTSPFDGGIMPIHGDVNEPDLLLPEKTASIAEPFDMGVTILAQAVNEMHKNSFSTNLCLLRTFGILHRSQETCTSIVIQ